MPPFLSSCKACMRLLSGKNCGVQLKEGLGLGLLRRGGEVGVRLDRFSHSRVLSSRVRTGGVDFGNSIGTTKEIEHNAGNLQRNSQIRRFLGCGDGDEGSVLSKTYEEKRVIGYAPEQLFAVVEAVDLYEDFVPWCQRSRILRRNEDGSFDAELEIGFKLLVESYISHVEMEKPKYIKVASMFFKDVVSRLVGSFDDRCQRIYGPAKPVIEQTYGKSSQR
ncbi:polyketide cyclase / dehydrase and lipid transport protein isoform X2 [Carex rostrata]